MTNQTVRQGILVERNTPVANQLFMKVCLFNEDGEPIVDLATAAPDTGAEVLLTGYTPVAADDVAAADTVNAAIAKLEARIAALETTVADHESRLDVLEA